jgi:hypothetical protein
MCTMCRAGYRLSVRGHCLPCGQHCLLCRTATTSCDVCAAGYYSNRQGQCAKVKSLCRKTCKGWHLSACHEPLLPAACVADESHQRRCMQCHAGCAVRCSPDGNCTGPCLAGYGRVGGRCRKVRQGGISFIASDPN